MALDPKIAEKVLLERYGEPAKEPTKYVIGFRNSVGRVLAMHRMTRDTRIWFQLPAPPAMPGITVLAEPNNGNSNINGPLAPLRNPDTQRVEIEDVSSLRRFLDWHDGIRD